MVKKEKIKKPLNSYFQFIKDKRNEIVLLNPNSKSIIDISKNCSEIWKNLSINEKEKYIKLANEDLKNHIIKKNEKKKKRKLTPYNLFLKNQLPQYKLNNPNLSHREAFSNVVKLWNNTKKYANIWENYKQ